MAIGVALFFSATAFAQNATRQLLRGHLPPGAVGLPPLGRVASSARLNLAIGLPLRNETALDELLREIYDPASPSFHKYLTPEQFTEQFGPTEQDYESVAAFMQSNGLAVTARHPNRAVLDVSGSAADIEKVFHVTMRTYRHPTEARGFFAPDAEPSVDLNIPVLHVSGLDNFSLRRPNFQIRPAAQISQAAPNAGSAPNGNYRGNDFRAAYLPGVTTNQLSGAGQTIALLQFEGYYSNDIASYESQSGLPSVPLVNVLIDGFRGVPATPSADSVLEVSLDIEMAISMAPGVSKIIVYEESDTSPWPDILSRMANDNLARQISCSWGNTSPGAPDPTSEGIFKQMAAQGQTFFCASGDSDAFGSSGIPFPAESTNITQVGGTTLTTGGPGGAYVSETVWNWGGGTGSSGGVSVNYGIPIWQQGISMTANKGSTSKRNVPDVALTADDVFVRYGNGLSATNVGGTSCAAPLWAGFTALVNQQAASFGSPPVGFVNPAIYAIGKATNYASAFHDITTGNNFKSSRSTKYPATAGYDLCTGWGTPNGTNFINALAPDPRPYFLAQPSGVNVTNGGNVAFSTSVGGQSPFNYRWLFNGTNLAATGNISGVATNILSITSATTNNSGNYSLVVSNNFSSVTSSVAVLNVGFAPAIFTQPTNLTIFSGDDATFSPTVGGSTPLVYQWQQNGTNISDDDQISGSSGNILTISAATTNSSGNYTLLVTNLFGSTVSSVASLTVNLIAPSVGSLVATPDGSFNLSLSGTPGFTYVLEATTNFSGGWIPVATNILDADGNWEFSDTQATNSTQKFYRLRQVQ